ncbi:MULTISPECIES: calcium-binding protein [Streptomyces]|uniref:calcium-binding protein n=1 Tax=Streptomyces TaxID=1883 RepID=UPI0006ADCB47|nr:calcium-binding protein [Streptomyces sp. XY66]
MDKALPRTAALVTAVLGLTLVLTGPAGATPGAHTPEASAGGTLVGRTGTSVTVTAAVGLSNTISVWQVGDTIRVKDTGDTMAALGGCTAVSAHEAVCPGAGTLTELVVHAGDQADDVTSFLETLGVTLVGGPGDDSLHGGNANDTLEGDEGADFLSGGGGNDTLTGSSGPDRLFGGPGNDSIEGLGGSDLINAGAGNDVVSGGKGNDQVIAGSGNDFVDGGPGRDDLDAVDEVSGNDYVRGGDQTDACRADLGDSVTECP